MMTCGLIRLKRHDSGQYGSQEDVQYAKHNIQRNNPTTLQMEQPRKLEDNKGMDRAPGWVRNLI